MTKPKTKMLGRCNDDLPIRYIITFSEPLSGDYKIAVCTRHYNQFAKESDITHIQRIQSSTDIEKIVGQK